MGNNTFFFFSLSLVKDWVTASIDFRNAFAQAVLSQPIFLKLPPGYVQANPQCTDLVMKINKSLYGNCCAANLWYRKFQDSLINDLGFKPSEIDPCLFVCKDVIIVLLESTSFIQVACESAP